MLGIETSCDETSIALVDGEGRVLRNDVASQIDLHARFGGVVPEVASRRHLEVCLPMVRDAVGGAEGVGWDDVDAIAVTQGPGLIGCLLMGVETAKALAWIHSKPLIPVHHLLAHLYAPFLLPDAPGATHLLMEAGEARAVVPVARHADEADSGVDVRAPEYPHLGLVVSGGHTSLVWVTAPGRCEHVAVTVDDAAGEAYDKVARLLGLGYPGGPVIDRLAAQGDPARFHFTPPMMRRDRPDFSFSGLKTAVAREIGELRGGGEPCEGPDSPVVADLCAGFQAAVVEALLTKTLWANESRGARDVLVVGGVACNRGLRRAAQDASRGGARFWFPHPSLCTDNAAMIAGLAHHLAPAGAQAALELNPRANWPMVASATEAPSWTR
jgi:N6-L-threonylcarbamoyladenine synthase